MAVVVAMAVAEAAAAITMPDKQRAVAPVAPSDRRMRRLHLRRLQTRTAALVLVVPDTRRAATASSLLPFSTPLLAQLSHMPWPQPPTTFKCQPSAVARTRGSGTEPKSMRPFQ